jgi:predicted unusual protein kinase regulating ubiquinone biosynthesis (AarF/ABC1/UbiB family)
MFVVFIKCLGLFIKFKLHYIDYNNTIKIMLQEFSKINILHIKALQWNIQGIINTSPEISEYFENFSDNVPYSEKDINYAVFHSIQNYAKTVNQTLSIDNNFKPFKSGTIALVFKGLLNDKPIVIKMLRKDINKEIEYGINNIIITTNIISFIFSFFYKINTSCFIKNIESNRKLLMEQTDFKKEIQNNEIFQELSKLHPNIVIPHIYKEFNDISDEIIIMDFLESQPLNSINNLENYKNTFIKFTFDTLFVHCITHADMHKGNFLFLKDNKIGILDFGMIVQNISRDHCSNIIDILFSIKNSDINRLIHVLSKTICDDSSKRIIIKEKITNVFNSISIINNNSLSLWSSDKIILFLKSVVFEIDDIPSELATTVLSFISFLNVLLNIFYTNRHIIQVCKELIENIV